MSNQVYFYPTAKGWVCEGPGVRTIRKETFKDLIKAYRGTSYYAKQSLARSPKAARELSTPLGVEPQPARNSPAGVGEADRGVAGDAGQPEPRTSPFAA